ncbi:hypothetical protein TanjilG_23872 [Lupinus angustifolius]|uniref:DUF7054 domain-containing protein n=1 Tax=Lupinus angustifolius TaxID=3871 RepID=A0A4P1QV78_LUPAN|nr:hypothetical protein TanjilG_23872 [Lupinus angustifolius]
MVNMKKSSVEKMLQQKRTNKGIYDHQRTRKNNVIKFLIIISVPGSTGPLRFLVNEREKVSRVIDRALKNYAREERLPVLGFEASNFLLYRVDAEFDGMVCLSF